MGSYLNSCSLTNQTIREKEEVVIVPLFSHIFNPDVKPNDTDYSFDFSFENSFKPFPYSFIFFNGPLAQLAERGFKTLRSRL